MWKEALAGHMQRTLLGAFLSFSRQQVLQRHQAKQHDVTAIGICLSELLVCAMQSVKHTQHSIVVVELEVVVVVCLRRRKEWQVEARVGIEGGK